MVTTYQCNKCGQGMEFEDQKLILGRVSAENLEKLNIHICPDCEGSVIDFCNEPPKNTDITELNERLRQKRLKQPSTRSR